VRRIYLTPIEGTGLTRQDAKKPKYFSAYRGQPVMDNSQIIWYGLLMVAMVDCPNMDQATHDALTANPDVIAFPENLTNAVGANVATVQAGLDSFSIPSSWVNSATTYQEIMTRLYKLFDFANSFHYWFGQKVMRYLWDSGTRINQLPGDLLADIQAAADVRGIDTTGIAANMTIKEAIGLLSQRIP